MEYQNHPLAELFPMIGDSELKELSENIKQNGLQVPVMLYEGKILDGRNRYAACKMADVEPDTVEYTGTDPLQSIISLNLHRRHLSESQRAVVASKIANMESGKRTDLQEKERDKSKTCEPSANLPSPPISLEKAANMMNISRRSAVNARRVMRDAPEQVAAIERGESTINKAIKEIKEKENMLNKKRPRPAGNLPLSFKVKIAALVTEIEILNDRNWILVDKKEAKKEITKLLNLF